MSDWTPASRVEDSSPFEAKTPFPPGDAAIAPICVAAGYAEVVLRLGSVELQVQRNRAELELHAQRIAELQDLVRSLNKATLSPALSSEIPPLPLPLKPTVES